MSAHQRMPTRSERVAAAAEMVRRYRVSHTVAAMCLDVSVVEIRIALGLDSDLRRMQ